MNSLDRQTSEITVAVPWGQIAAKVYGSASEKKVLVAHGILDNAGSFDRLMKLLPQEYQYACIDLPGHGLSSPFPPGKPLQFFDYVYSISLVLDALKWKSCIYIGHSFGAHIGTYFSILYPGKLEKIICIDGLFGMPTHNITSYIQTMYDLNSYSASRESLYSKEDIIYALRFKRKETLTTDAAEAMFPRAVTKVGNLYKLNRDPRLRIIPKPVFNLAQQKEVLVDFKTPLLVIVASNSTNVEALMEMLTTLHAAVGRRFRFITVFVQGNHDVHNNYPERVAPHICNFLNDDLKSKL